MRSTSWRSTYFYPRPPRGGRLKTDEACLDIKAFLSTPSARRATDVAAAGHDLDAISIHALREEGDREPTPRTEAMQFLSTPSARRATPPARKRAPQKKFLSTPSARRATSLRWTPDCRDQNFYPRPPRGGRHPAASSDVPVGRFLSTPSARRATSLIPY